MEKNLKLKNEILINKLNFFKNLSKNIDENILKINDLLDNLLTNEEIKCQQMVEFDEEMNFIKNKIFKYKKKNKIFINKKKIEEIILKDALLIQNMEKNECYDHLLTVDPIIENFENEINLIKNIFHKYHQIL